MSYFKITDKNLLIISFFILIGACLQAALFGPNLVSNYLSALSFVILIISRLLYDKRVFYLSFFLIYSFFGQILSVLIIEHGWSLIELGGVNGHLSLSLIFLSITAFIVVTSATYLIKKSIYKKVDFVFLSKIKKNKILYYVPIVYLILIFAPVLMYGTAFSYSGGNRLEYRSNIPAFFGYLFQIRALIFPLAGIYLLNKRKTPALVYLFLAVIWNVLIGEKASGLIVTVYTFLVPFVLVEYKKFSYKAILFTLLTSVILIIVSILANYVLVEGSNASFIFDRMSMQGQLWWYYSNTILFDNGMLHPISHEFSSSESGLIALMHSAMPENIYNFYMANNIILTNGFPAIFVFYFGGLWLIPSLFCCLAYIFPVYFLSRSLYLGHIFSFLISVRIFTSIITLMAEGSIAKFLDYKFFVYVIVLLLLKFLPRVRI